VIAAALPAQSSSVSPTPSKTIRSWLAHFTASVNLKRCLNVGVSGPGVVNHAVQHADPEMPLQDLAELIKKLSFKLARAGELVGREAARRLGIPFGIIDLSLAPTPVIGDSVAKHY